MLDHDPIAQQLLDLPRTTQHGISAFLIEVPEEFVIDGTSVRLRTFHVALDRAGRPRTRDLLKAVSNHVLDYAIPRSRILEAKDELSSTGSTSKIVQLSHEARNLFTSLPKTGEGGELLLFTLCEQVLKLPLVIAKMNLKTDTEMHFHGADGVYASINESQNLILYWGESKIYNDRTKGASDCFDSIAKLLSPEYGDPDEEQRDLELLRNYSDLGNPELTNKFQDWLQSDNPDFNDVEFGGVCLIGFDDESYPSNPYEMNNSSLKKAIQNKLKNYSETISYYTKKHSLSAFNLITICIPIPSSEDFREQFLEIIGKKSGGE